MSDRAERMVGSAVDELPAPFVEQVRERAFCAGVSQHTFDAAFAGLSLDPDVVRLCTSQPEHNRSVGQYVDGLVTQERTETGRTFLQNEADRFGRLTQKYGVPPEILLAIWAIESNFGTVVGRHQVIRSLATLAVAEPRRAAFWQTELIAALQILEAGDVEPDGFVGSWAGAFGQTQFMPSTYLDYAVDFDGDGKRNVWTSVDDALASAANYLMRSGWRESDDWGGPVRLSETFDLNIWEPEHVRSAGAWAASGVDVSASIGLGQSTASLRLILPAGWRGPAFLVSANFDAILTYNRSVPYALAVGCLADRIRGDAPPDLPWPRDPPLTLAVRRELQQRLVDQGFDTGGVDGILGSASLRAIRQYQRNNGLKADGYADKALFEHICGP